MLKRLIFTSASFFLALAGPLSVAHAAPQSQSQIAVLIDLGSCGHALAITETGDVYRSDNGLQAGGFHFVSNVFEGGQPPSPVVSATMPVPDGPFLMVGTANGDVYRNDATFQAGAWHLQSSVGIAANSSLASLAYCPSGPSLLLAAATNGDVFRASDGYGTSWTLIDNVFSGSPTGAASQAWGSVKARYR